MGILTETLVCEDMTLCTDLARRHVVDEIATVLYSNSYYTVLASIFTLARVGEGYSTLCVCVCVCVCYHKIAV